MPTNNLTIVPVKLDPLPVETTSFHSSQSTTAPSCVIKTAATEILFFNVVGSSTATNPFEVTTTSGDAASVTLTFSASVATSDVAVVDLATTTKDTATVAQGTKGTELKVSFENVTDITTKTFEVTYNGLKYTVAYNKDTKAWTVTRKQ